MTRSEKKIVFAFFLFTSLIFWVVGLGAEARAGAYDEVKTVCQGAQNECNSKCENGDCAQTCGFFFGMGQPHWQQIVSGIDNGNQSQFNNGIRYIYCQLHNPADPNAVNDQITDSVTDSLMTQGNFNKYEKRLRELYGKYNKQ